MEIWYLNIIKVFWTYHILGIGQWENKFLFESNDNLKDSFWINDARGIKLVSIPRAKLLMIKILLSSWYSLDWDLQTINGARNKLDNGLQTSSCPCGWLVPAGNEMLGAVKLCIEHRPGKQGSISSDTRLGGGTYKKVCHIDRLFCVIGIFACKNKLLTM